MAMRRSVSRLARLLCCVSLGGACRHAPPPPAPLIATVSGTIPVEGLSSRVRVVRDRWGVPHIYAEHQDDLFFAQGFVQAQDRLFQMDLWRRSAQGRLAEVLGSNFVGRDAMTQRMQYRGDLETEWAIYGADTKAIATAFVGGVNAWVAMARERPPEEFVLAGWRPEFWRPEDLLNRTDAFLASGDALDEVFRARLAAAIGSARAGALLPGGSLVVPAGLEPAAVSYVVGDALRRVGTAPFFTGLAAPVVGSNAWAVTGRRSATGAPLLAADPHRPLTNPSLRYLVHLRAPGWNVIGATSPWLPGVAIGHNDRVAWGMTSFRADTEDLYVERLNPRNRHQVLDRGRWINTTVARESVWVKGRSQPVGFEREETPHGVVVAVDGEKHLAFTVRWSGAEPGTAGELAALTLDRAASASEFRAALARWKMPAAEVLYVDRDGNGGSQVAALVPKRHGWTGSFPAPGWTARFDWSGWLTLDELPHVVNPAEGSLVSANGSLARTARLQDALTAAAPFTIETFKRLQHDVVVWNAGQIVPLLSRVPSGRADIERARTLLLKWDRRQSIDSTAATIYAAWERRLRRRLAERRIPAELLDEFIGFVARTGDVLVPSLKRPSRVWFDGDALKARDALFLDALEAAVNDPGVRDASGDRRWGQVNALAFEHPLAVNERARRRLNVGPFERGGYPETVMSVSRVGAQAIGASFAAIFDVADWNRSVAQNAPGQSGSPASPHFADLAAPWAAGEYFPLLFGDAAVQANAAATLVLTPPNSERVAK
jgi:penicillin amidase